MMNLQPEIGVTQVSLKNGEILARAYGPPRTVRLLLDLDGEWYRTVVTYDNNGEDIEHVFLGFAWGYGGEGPSGFARWCSENNVPLRGSEIVNLRNAGEAGEVWNWARSPRFPFM